MVDVFLFFHARRLLNVIVIEINESAGNFVDIHRSQGLSWQGGKSVRSGGGRILLPGANVRGGAPNSDLACGWGRGSTCRSETGAPEGQQDAPSGGINPNAGAGLDSVHPHRDGSLWTAGACPSFDCTVRRNKTVP